MRSTSCVSLIALSLLASPGAQAPARPQAPSYTPRGSLQDYFVGTWQLVLTENRYADGKAEPYPEKTDGYSGSHGTANRWATGSTCLVRTRAF